MRTKYALNLDLTGRAALVTGGSRGIGRATCLALAAHGARVAVHFRAESARADEVVDEIHAQGGEAVALQADLRDAAAAPGLAAAAAGALGPIDILVNNAGEMVSGSVEELTDRTWEDSLSLNLSAAFRMARACIPAMKARNWGRIIGLSTQAVYTGSRNYSAYAAAKAGLRGLTFSLVKEVGENGITVNLVAPGRIATDLIMRSSAGRMPEWMAQTPVRRLGQPEEVAAAIVFLASEAASYITGATLHVNGGLVMD
ncbi:MAG: SDR family NAD(P)-dependent oxidoreductase [Bryobacteraceae bacterium]